jgi:hypothetical protein
MSVEYVKLKQKDLDLLVEVLQYVLDYKYHSLAKHNWIEFEDRYLPKVIKAINDNQFKVVNSNDNILVWIQDQIIHSRRYVERIPKKDWIPLVDFDATQQCLTMLRAASKGQVSYNTYNQGNRFTDLFN